MHIVFISIMIISFLVMVFIAFWLYKKETNNIFIERTEEGKFNVYLPRDTYQKLEELRNATGKETLGETLRCALKWYDEEKHGE